MPDFSISLSLSESISHSFSCESAECLPCIVLVVLYTPTFDSPINVAPNSFMIIYLCYVFSIYIQILFKSKITRWWANKYIHAHVYLRREREKLRWYWWKKHLRWRIASDLANGNVYWSKRNDLNFVRDRKRQKEKEKTCK